MLPRAAPGRGSIGGGAFTGWHPSWQWSVRAEIPGMLGKGGCTGLCRSPESCGSEGRQSCIRAQPACPSLPGQGGWLWTCPLAAGVARHSWAQSASVGSAVPTLRATGEWWGQCVGS